ncbi:MAG: ribbon-helix-helix protein, CopG family [Acidipropionibacterium acidipropionici]|jgi:hypothetical protein|uniref:CopG family transcriptional regulator n=2 Tax=Acidipropionibacterium acidipropionici TaxID=1748 RepID=A0A142KGU1_9ACTN|nr:ribbon-helix-helix protein, CopG family [Acidipropionibacterium acidipropionici]AFV90660.1 Ribbon-helix-helix protein, CopG family [Acidipropionibacterium acidipropionici ATCC 4875]ALN15161.1 CopG family transcriptional regulator [Acidipropionibacterium acidipropionici]AMS05329.1 CopG family transcriptional regulator [Acidipropionibacterium acidipropionici]AOZ46807.1 CopG family transcriptional regulator [Acidipropionibacterium acidipropionici]APZ09088.1 CopG family transcriptional regulato
MNDDSNHEIRHGVDIGELSDWAESDAPFDTPQTSPVLTGDEAKEASRAFLARVGQPTLGHSHAQGTGRSPRRQVRLPEDMNARLDAYASRHGGNASAIIREAVAEYLDRIGA